MATQIRAKGDKLVESEKVTLNIGYVDLGRIDLLVQEGFYANRSDLIRTAVRNQLAVHEASVARSVERHAFDMGLRDVTAAELVQLRASGASLRLKVIGLVRIAADVSAELAGAAIAEIQVLGALQASAEVKAVLRDRIR